MVRNFKGQVRIEDVQKEFDDLTTSINKTIDEYNSADKVKEIDYTRGGPNLGNSGYCLTVGGLKQFLNLFDKQVIGCRPYKNSDNSIMVSDGLFITKDNIEKIKGVTMTGKGPSLYYDYDNKQLVYSQDGQPVYSGFDIPQYTSSNTWGNISCNNNSGEAWKARRNDNQAFMTKGIKGILVSNSDAQSTWPIKWTWQFGEQLKASGNKITARVTLGSGYDAISLDDWKTFINLGLVWINCAAQVNGVNLGKGDYGIDQVGNIWVRWDIPNGMGVDYITLWPKASTLKNAMGGNDRLWQNVGLKNVTITGPTKTIQYYTDGGGRGIKICDLNWNIGSSLAIDTLNNVKFSDE